MSTAFRIQHPFQYVLQTFGLSILYTGLIAGLSSTVLSHLNGLGPLPLRYGLLAVFGLAFLGSQLEIASETSESSSDLTRVQMIFLVIGAFLIYNGIIAFAGFVGTILYSAGYPSIAIFASFIYPLWEIKTADRSIPIPLSFLGIVTFLGWILIKIGFGAWERLTLIRDNVELPLLLLDKKIGQIRRPSL